MANSVNCFIKFSKLNSEVELLLNTIKEKQSFHFKEINNLTYEYITTYMDFDSISDISKNTSSTISLIYYDTAMGYLRERIYNCGYLTNSTSAFFSMDTEIEVDKESIKNNVSFYEQLKLFLLKNGTEESNFPSIGDYISIDENTCTDTDILDWLDTQTENRFKINHIELESNGIWVDNCEYRIDINECAFLDKTL